MKIFLKVFIILLLMSIHSSATIPYFKVLQPDRENNNVHINVLFQDDDAFLWLGTDNGLYKYDGFSFTHINPFNNDSDQNVTAITEDFAHVLFIGMNNGEIISRDKNKTVKIKTPFKSPVRTLYKTNEQTLWVATYGEGIFILDKSGWHHLSGLPDQFIYKIVPHPSGVLLAGSDAGLIVIDTRNNKLQYSLYDTKKGLPDNLVKEIYCDKNGEVWLGMQEKGVCKFNLDRKSFEVPENLQNWHFGSVNSMVKLENEFWIGTNGYGIIDFEFRADQRVRKFSSENNFDYTNIKNVIRNKDGSIWIASENKLIFSTGDRFELVKESDNVLFDSIHAVASDKNGLLWIANNKGLFCYNYKNAGSVKRYLTDAKYRNLHIVSLYVDESGYIWLGTFDNGLYRLDPSTNDVSRYAVNEGLRNANVISINGSGNRLWLATLGGITLCEKLDSSVEDNGYKFTNYPREEGHSSVFVYCVYIAKDGRAWFGTDGMGINVYDKGKFTGFDDFDGGKGKVVYSITEDEFGNIWFSTLNHGVYRFDGKTFRNFNLTSGLRDLNISGLTNDNHGNIIVIHAKGIDIINPKTFELEYIGKEVGIEYLDCDLNAVTTDEQNNIWIGSQHGLIRFNNHLEIINRHPETHIQKTYSYMKAGAGLNDSVFSYNQNQISFEYIGLWFANPEAVSYRYRLVGLSNKWISTRERIVTYPNLTPGSYRFEVMSSYNNQFLNPGIDFFNFVIHKPLYKETWFILLIGLLIGSGLFWFIRDRELRFRRMESLKKEKIEFQFETLKSQVNPHFLFNSFNTLISLIEEDKKNAVTYVENLSDYFRNMVQHRDKDVVLLSDEIEMVKTYFYLQQQRYGDNLSLKFNIPEEWKSKYELPPLSLQLLIENAVKHNAVSHESKLYITVSATDHESLLIVNNLNPKLRPDKSTGIGLENLISRLRILSSQEVNVQKTETEFKVEIPLIKSS